MSEPTATPALGYADARGCKEWLNALPLTNAPVAQAQLLDGVRAFQASPLPGLEGLKCLELMREKVAFVLGEQRGRYFGKTLPLSPADAQAWSTGRALLEAMEAAWRGCLAASARDEELRRHAALVSQRLVRNLGAQMYFHRAVYRRFDPQLWTRLHQLYHETERQGLAMERVKDSLEADEAGSSVADAYAHVVLLQAAYLSELTAPQIDFVDSLLRQWARKVGVRRAPEDGTLPPSVHPLVVDFEKPIGARPLAPREVTSHHRILDVMSLSQSLRKRIHGLRRDEDLASMRLPPQAAAIDALGQLERLHRLWCEGAPVRPPAKVPEEKSAGLAFGFGEIHFFLTNGKAFEAPDRSRELTSREKQDIEVFGRITSRTQNMRVAEQNFVLEPWGVIDEMAGAWRLVRPEKASKGVSIGRLVAMRLGDTGAFFLGAITALVQETDGRIVVTVTLFPGKPEPVAVRPDSRGRAPGKWVEGFRLPPLERLHVPRSLVVPMGVATKGRGVDVWEEGAKSRDVTGFLDRGAEFDRVSLA